MSWYLSSLVALLFYGAWGFWGAKASAVTNAKSALFYSSLGTLTAGLICLSMSHFRPDISIKGMSFGFLTGLSTGLGTLFFIMALRNGPIIPIIMITALYPLVTTIMCVFLLGQHISLKQTFGIGFSILAIYLLTVK